MAFISRTSIGVAALVIGLGTGGSAFAQGKAPESVEIGMPRSLFQGVPEFFVRAGSGPFLKLMKDATHINGNIQHLPDAMTLAARLNDGKCHLGVFLGHEFAWAREKYPDLTPIAVADPMNPNQAFCLVAWDCKAKHIGDLKGEKISLPPIHRDFCELYLAKQKEAHMKGESFAAQLKGATAEDTIFDVIEGKCALAVVDAASLKAFQRLHPGQFKNLKVLCQSEAFPCACIAVKKGEMDDKTVEKFRKALLKSPELPGGRPMLATWKLNGFKPVPADYAKQLEDSAKKYPLPPALRAAVDK